MYITTIAKTRQRNIRIDIEKEMEGKDFHRCMYLSAHFT